MFQGSIVALVTPFNNDAVDTDKLRDLVEFHIAAGTNAIVAAGTTGESGTLNLEERLVVLKTVLSQAKERIAVIAGTGANSTKECIINTQLAMKNGAHAALIMTPAYIKPTQEGLYQHYSEIAAAAAIPIILYNVPSRTACDLLPETVGRLSQISNIIAIKEAVEGIDRLRDLQDKTDNKLDIFSGNDSNAAEWMLAGAKGIISVAANIIPKRMAELATLALAGKKNECLALDKPLQVLFEMLFVESNPIPAKWALSNLGLIKNELRLPLTPLQAQYQEPLTAIINQLT